jgi:hypothetical protein
VLLHGWTPGTRRAEVIRTGLRASSRCGRGTCIPWPSTHAPRGTGVGFDWSPLRGRLSAPNMGCWEQPTTRTSRAAAPP